MIESEWLACRDPSLMLEFLRGNASDRKLRLFACACARRVLPRTKDRATNRRTIEFAERYADGLASRNDLLGNAWGKPGTLGGVVQRHAWDAATDSSDRAAGMLEHQAMESDPVLLAEFDRILDDAWLKRGFNLGEAVRIAERSSPADWIATGKAAKDAEQTEQARLVRCIFGNPFSPTVADPAWLAWRDGAIPQLAQALYDDRDFAALPILADALEEASCGDAELLAHLRGSGPHARGCWALDLVLGKR